MLSANRKRNLTFRLIITFVAALALTLASIFFYIFVLNPNLILQRTLDKQLHYLSEELIPDAEGRPSGKRYDEKYDWVYKVLSTELLYQITDNQGRAIMQSSPDADAIFNQVNPQFSTEKRLFSVTYQGLLYHVNSAHLANYPGYYVQVAGSDRLLSIFQLTNLKPLSVVAVLVSLICLLLISLVVWLTIGYMLRPLKKASATAAKIEPHSLTQRLDTHKLPEEVLPLINAFNQTLDRLEKGFKVQQELLATTAHELKTPLSLLRGEIEMAEHFPKRELLLRDVDQMARLIHQLLHWAESRECQNYQYQSLYLSDVAEEVVLYLNRLAVINQVHIVVSGQSEAMLLHADRSTCFVLMKNLLENAIHHAPSHSVIELTITSRGITVRDYGAGIAPEHLPWLFTRFWRGPHRRNEGAGLGLAICAEIATTHGWQLKASNSSPGACFSLQTSP
ncbi:ATP-binding protein [Rheinheimera sp. 1928-s]|uniref:sensor histidine kinase n=1 Tax=Rheinheimera sp. 1928-s TaxID=3033803 RepID=UPI00262FBF0F|nr:ATP-binding protein [Rheinheimera sp. 1928-s]MDF3125517.1 ATP-binding protein [Rheinheimera sp. 1928-s]